MTEGRKVELSNRQYEVAALIAEGKVDKVIAHELGVTEGTVKVVAQHVYRKLGLANSALNNRVMLTRWWLLERGK